MHVDVFFFPCLRPLQSDIAALYIKVGLKNIGTVFLHTDAQIPDERFLVLINDMLASGLTIISACFVFKPIGSILSVSCSSQMEFLSGSSTSQNVLMIFLFINESSTKDIQFQLVLAGRCSLWVGIFMML